MRLTKGKLGGTVNVTVTVHGERVYLQDVPFEGTFEQDSGDYMQPPDLEYDAWTNWSDDEIKIAILEWFEDECDGEVPPAWWDVDAVRRDLDQAIMDNLDPIDEYKDTDPPEDW